MLDSISTLAERITDVRYFEPIYNLAIIIIGAI